MNKMKQYIKTKWGIIGVVALLVIVLIITRAFKNGDYEIYDVVRADLNQSITVSGKVVPAQEIDLGFEATGRVASVSVEIGDEVKAGDVLAKLDTSEINNEILESQAALESQIAKLNELTSLNDGESQLVNKQTELLNVLKKAYVTADDIVRNKIDVFVTDPNSRFPEFNKALSNYFIRQEINEKRFEVQSVLSDWKSLNDKLSPEMISVSDATYSIDQLRKIEDLLNSISSGTDEFSPTSGTTQSQIDAYITTISNSRTTVAGLIVDINQTTESVRDVAANIPVQEAELRTAQASLARINSRFSDYIITAPFDGVVTAREIEPGEAVEIGKSAISVIGEAGLEIETFVPEVLVAGVDLNDRGFATLDAFGELSKFEVFVSHVDPSETEKDGLTTYRTLIDFTNDNDQIRPGMTAEVEIIKDGVTDVLQIPTHLIESEGTNYFVNVVGEKDKREITLGLNDGKGSVEVLSGLSENERLFVPEEK
jgi:multidrug efflux pump subunit AcrA (membrane-fusion protein)